MKAKNKSTDCSVEESGYADCTSGASGLDSISGIGAIGSETKPFRAPQKTIRTRTNVTLKIDYSPAKAD